MVWIEPKYEREKNVFLFYRSLSFSLVSPEKTTFRFILAARCARPLLWNSIFLLWTRNDRFLFGFCLRGVCVCGIWTPLILNGATRKHIGQMQQRWTDAVAIAYTSNASSNSILRSVIVLYILSSLWILVFLEFHIGHAFRVEAENSSAQNYCGEKKMNRKSDWVSRNWKTPIFRFFFFFSFGSCSPSHSFQSNRACV